MISPLIYAPSIAGIGTYTADGSSVNAGWFGNLKRSVSKTVDQALATTFESHVMAGYRFLMRYYGPGDRIYIFGFSRGAFTARFLARMVSKVGLLSMGNEELVPFTYKTYHDYEMGHCEKSADRLAYIDRFKATFCRCEHGKGQSHSADEAGIKVHFLGLFDTVSSVGTLDVPLTKTMQLPKVGGTAKHVRHAVAIDECRVKFKAALLAQDIPNVGCACKNGCACKDGCSGKNGCITDGRASKDRCTAKNGCTCEDILEVWFPGNHGDVGGGWLADDPVTKQDDKPKSWWKDVATKFSGFFIRGDPPPPKDVKDDNYQLSDIALKWMMDELDKLPEDRIQWNKHKDGFIKHFKRNRDQAIGARIHDTLSFGGGCSWLKVILWNFMGMSLSKETQSYSPLQHIANTSSHIIEYLPFIRRWEYLTEEDKDGWYYIALPLNKGGRRDIPFGARFHHSVKELMEGSKYRPTNQLSIKNKDNVTKPTGLETVSPLRFRVFQKGKSETDNIYTIPEN